MKSLILATIIGMGIIMGLTAVDQIKVYYCHSIEAINNALDQPAHKGGKNGR